MIILYLKTSDDTAELYLKDGDKLLAEESWKAGRELSITLHSKIDDILDSNNLKTTDVEGLAVFKGPGSFTGLRIGITVFNTMAYGLGIPIVSETGEDWVDDALARLNSKDDEKIVQPFYGGEPNITKPRK